MPVFGALLKAHNEYGFNRNSCAPGSLNFMLAVLEGRMPDAVPPPPKPVEAKASKDPPGNDMDLRRFKELLQKVTDDFEV